MAAVYITGRDPALFHLVARKAGEAEAIHMSGYCDRIYLKPRTTPLFTENAHSVPIDYLYDGDTVSLRRIAPADARPPHDKLAYEMALAVIMGDMAAAAALADRLAEFYRG